MSKKLYISTRGKTHAAALTENGRLIEFHRESEDDISIVGNIYKGRVEKVIQGMQAAFVDIGREKNGYLYVGESLIDSRDLENAGDIINRRIMEREGDEIMVQVAKSETGTKGARLTSNVSLAGRYLVYLPYVDYIGISRKITDEATRERLFNLVSSFRSEGGYIVRTACASADDAELKSDSDNLKKRWSEVKKSYDEAQATELAYSDGELCFRAIRDLVTADVESVVCDNEKTLERVRGYMSLLDVSGVELKLYQSKVADMFFTFGLSSQILKVLDSKVELENGAYLIIEKTEAMTVIDVNTGKYIGSENLEQTVFETNLLAAQAIASQLRLRNIGGIIIVDFIDMTQEAHKQKLLELLEKLVREDRVRTNIVGMTKLGLVEITRRKTRVEIKKEYARPCPYCGGKGYMMNNIALQTMLRIKINKQFEEKDVSAVLITTSAEVADDIVLTRALSFELSVFWTEKRIYVCADSSFKGDKIKITAYRSDLIDLPEGAKLLY